MSRILREHGGFLAEDVVLVAAPADRGAATGAHRGQRPDSRGGLSVAPLRLLLRPLRHRGSAPGQARFPWLRFATRIKSLKERLLEAGWINASALVFDSARALERVQRLGDLFAPVLALSQHLPRRPPDSLLRSRARKP